MIRDVDIKEISDGRFYGPNDMVRADTGDCRGCSRCCHGMCDTILLEPLDVYHLEQVTGLSFDMLLEKHLRLRIADGLILPHLADTGEDAGCIFLNAEGRCSIHAARPALCRLYPLGRFYQEEDFVYILQVHECDHPRSKIKVRRWLQIPELPRYEEFVRKWHAFLRTAGKMAQEDESIRKPVCMAVLKHFYRRDWDLSGDFYPQFEKALCDARHEIGLA